MFAQLRDQKCATLIKQGVVDGGAAKVDASYELHGLL
jgi:hypothetical protein